MGHNPLLLTLTILLPCFFVVTMVFNALSGSPEKSGGLFENTVGNLSDKYYLEITPAGWTFSIWGFIYTWQALWIVYAIVNLFRKSPEGPYYTYPVVLTAPFLVTYLLSSVFNIGWLQLFDKELLELALAALFLISLSIYVCLFLSYRSLDRSIDTLIKQGRKSDVWLTRFLVHNGLGIYGTWVTIATLLNLGFVLSYRSSHDISQQDAATVCLGVLSAEIVAFLITDLKFLDRYTRYTFTPYLVLIVALTGSISKNYEDGARNSIFTVVLLAVACVAAVVKIIVLVWRHVKYTSDGVKAVSSYTMV